MMTTKVETVAPDALYRRCDPGQFSFASTAELAADIHIIGQERAVEAVRFGVGMRQGGYNLYALGSQGMYGEGNGRLTTAEKPDSHLPLPDPNHTT